MLFVDDSAVDQALLKFQLKATGCELRVASNAAEAMGMLKPAAQCGAD